MESEVKNRKRPDKRDALLERENEQERAVPCGLASRIRDPGIRAKLVPEIERRVAQISKAKHAAGIILNDILIQCCATGGPSLPEIDQTFMRRLLLRDGANCPIIRGACSRYSCLPAPVRFQGDGQPYSSTAKEMLTSFKNILTEAFEARQKSTVKHFVRLNPECKGETWKIIKRINGWGLQEEMCDKARSYADHERSVMGIQHSVSKRWLECNPKTVLRAYVRWLNYREATGGKTFSVGPTFDVRAHHVTFDTRAMYGLFKSTGIVTCNEDTFRGLASEQIESIFRTSGLVGSSWHFNNNITTNGVVACFHFKRRKSSVEIQRSQDAKLQKRALKEAACARSKWRKAKPEAARAETNAKRSATLAEKKTRRKDPPLEPFDSSEAPELLSGTLSEDPGNSPNITYTVHSVAGKLFRRRFTIGRWYTESGVKEHQKNAARWVQSIQVEQAYVDAISIKTASRGQLLEHAQRFAEVGPAIWSEKLGRRWARGRFNISIGKPKSIDSFYRQVGSDGPVQRHFYGAAKWSHIKGCAVAPNNMIRQRSKMAFQGRQVCVDEHLTTQCCWKCQARTRPVERVSHGKTRKVRGLVFCDSKTCGFFLTNRDFQGAYNIGVCGQGPRPTRLTRQAPGKRRLDAMSLPLSPGMRVLGGESCLCSGEGAQ